MTKKKNYGTSGGIPITDEMIEKLVAEAEAGYDLSRLTPRRGRPAMGNSPASVFQVRLEPELRDAVDARAQTENTTPSEIVRRILRKELGTA